MKLVNFVVCSLLCFQHGGCDISSFFKGRWVASTKERDASYFQVKDSSIFAVKKNAKLSMDIKNIEHRPDQTVQFEMSNLRIHSVPMVFNIMDYKIVSALRLLMKHGLTLEFHEVSAQSMLVHWTIRDKENVLRKGHLTLTNTIDAD